jgi:hypothetical protein
MARRKQSGAPVPPGNQAKRWPTDATRKSAKKGEAQMAWRRNARSSSLTHMPDLLPGSPDDGPRPPRPPEGTLKVRVAKELC